MDRRVKAIKRDRQGNIVAFCNPGERWSPRLKADVIKDIVNNKKSYYVAELARRAYVRVEPGKVLRTTLDEASDNHLDRLPRA
jgi:hypothetical protein